MKLLWILLLTCNLSAFDYLKDFSGHPVHWDVTKPITYKVLNPKLKDSVEYALRAWNEAVDNLFVFEESDNPKITIDISNLPDPLLGTAQVISSTIFSLPFNARSYITGASILIKEEPLYDFETVVLHEIGHALGMLHAVKDIKGYYLQYYDQPTMYPKISINSNQKVLHVDDIMGIRELYSLDQKPFYLGGIIEKHHGKRYFFTLDDSSIPIIWWNTGKDDFWNSGQSAIEVYKIRGFYNIVATYRGRVSMLTVQIGKNKFKPKPVERNTKTLTK